MDAKVVTHSVIVAEAGQSVAALLDREWLLTNGTGAFAAGTAAGCNTRRYHGLLIASQQPPVGRIVGLSQVWEQIVAVDRSGRQVRPLAYNTCMFQSPEGEVFAPQGYRSLHRVDKGLGVCWEYVEAGVTFRRELLLHWRRQAATLRYTVTLPTSAAFAGGAKLRLHPMLTLRDFHGMFHRADTSPLHVQSSGGDTATFRRDGVAVTLRAAEGRWIDDDQTWHEVYYRIDDERGQESREDYAVPGYFELDLQTGATMQLTLTAALGEAPAEAVATHDARVRHLRPIVEHLQQSLGDAEHDGPPRTAALAIAADDFVVGRTIRGKALSTILAGYPWFADWGRDTFIALPGLLVCTGRYDEARDVLGAFAESIHNGLVPNRFDDYDDRAAHYNTVDASLWFVHAAMQYLEASGDFASWDGWLREACMSIVNAYIRGTDHGIRMAGDGLITAGSPQTQLTWMDAACDGVVFTPRHGKAVEINALWYNVLVGLTELLRDTDPDTARHFEKIAGRTRRAFAKVFWNEPAQCLFDHVWTDDQGQDHPDPSIRPNQIFVAALPRSPLPATKLRQIVAAVSQHLLTPFGLRTLPPDDPHYHPRYSGPQRQRDEAYHQGTVWPWLIGPYAEAVLRVGKFSKKAREEAQAAIDPLLAHLMDRGFGQLSEVHEAQPPHRPVGCFAQAWSVAEVLRVQMLIRT